MSDVVSNTWTLEQDFHLTQVLPFCSFTDLFILQHVSKKLHKTLNSYKYILNRFKGWFGVACTESLQLDEPISLKLAKFVDTATFEELHSKIDKVLMKKWLDCVLYRFDFIALCGSFRFLMFWFNKVKRLH